MAMIRPKFALLLIGGAIVFPLAMYQRLTTGTAPLGWPGLAVGTTAWLLLVAGAVVASRYEPSNQQSELAEYDDA